MTTARRKGVHNSTKSISIKKIFKEFRTIFGEILNRSDGKSFGQNVVRKFDLPKLFYFQSYNITWSNSLAYDVFLDIAFRMIMDANGTKENSLFLTHQII